MAFKIPNWKKLFYWFRQKTNPPVTNKLDHKLIKKNRSKLLPSWPQLKYLKHFLTSTEKTAIKIAGLIFVITAISWTAWLLIKNQTVVPTEGGEYSEALIGQPKFINPVFSSTNDVDSDLVYLIYSGLFRYNEQQKLLPDLASKYTVSEDKKTYNIELRQDVKWSDGQAFSADDVILTFSTIQNPAVNSPLIASFQGVTVEKISEYSVRFSLKEPFAPFLSSLTVGILPSHIWREIQPNNIKLAKNNLQPVGTGSWKFSKLVKDQAGNIQAYTLVPNEYYYKKNPYLKSLTFKFYPDYSQALNVLKTQEVKALSFLPRDLKDKISNKNFEFYKLNLPQYSALFINQAEESILTDLDLRLAMAYAINKDEIIKILDGTAEKINSPFLKNSLGYDDNLEYPNYSPASSTKLLDEEWKIIQPEDYFDIEYEKLLKTKQDEIDNIENDASSTPEMVSSTIEKITDQLKESVRQKMNSEQSIYRKNEDDGILEIKITTIDTSEYQDVAQAIAKNWQTVGIKTEIQLIDKYQIKDVLKKRDYQVLLYGEIIGNDPDPFPFWHSSQTNYPGLNLSGFSNRDADKLLEDARANATSTTRGQLYKDWQKILIDEMPAIFLYTPVHTMIVSKEINGIDISYISIPSERYVNINNWYTKTKKKINFLAK
ncbi:MAG: peptide ABC transporter substrate-binding protein [bacterium]